MIGLPAVAGARVLDVVPEVAAPGSARTVSHLRGNAPGAASQILSPKQQAAYGLWTPDYGLWTVAYGLWTVDYGLCMDYGLWTMDYGLWTIVKYYARTPRGRCTRREKKKL